MLPLLQDANPSVRRGIAIQLGETKLSPKIIVPRLIQLMKDKDQKVREQVVIALSKYDTFAIEPLIKLLNEEQVIDSKLRVGKDGQTNVHLSDLAIIALINCKSLSVDELFPAYKATRLSSKIRYILAHNEYITVSEFMPYLTSSDANKQLFALSFIYKFREHAGQAIPIVADLVDSKNILIRKEAMETLPFLGPKALPVIEHLLQNPKYTAEEQESLISKLDYNDTLSLPLLNKIVEKNANTKLRIRAVRTISEIRYFKLETAEILSRTLLDKNIAVAEASANTLSIILEGSAGNQPTIIPYLIKALRSPSGKVQSDAAYLLGNMKDLGAYSEMAVKEILGGLRRPADYAIHANEGFSNKSTEDNFITVLGKINTKDPPIILSVFLDMLRADSLKRMHATVIKTLENFKTIPDSFVPLLLARSTGINVFPLLAHIEPTGINKLITYTNNTNHPESNRVLAIKALGEADRSTQRLQSVLKNILNNSQSSFRIKSASAQALFLLGVHDMMVAEVMQRSIETSEKNTYEIIQVLEKDKKRDIPFIIYLFKTTTGSVRDELLELLWKLGPDPRVNKIVVSALNDKDEEVSEAAGELLMKAEPGFLLNQANSAHLVDSITKLIRKEIKTKTFFDTWKRTNDGGTRVTQPILPAFQLLNRLGPNARQALPILLPLLHHTDNKLQLETIKTIGNIGIDTLNVTEPLNLLLTNRDPAIQSAAANTLETLQPNKQFNNITFSAVCIDRFVTRHFRNHYDDIADYFRPSGLVSGRFPAGIPPFPWPPPRYSNIAKFGVELPLNLIGNKTTSLSSIYTKLIDALRQTDRNFEHGIFGVPGGFALLAKMERIHEDGKPLSGKYRWVMGKIPPLSLSDYIGQLFFENKGYFRVIAFVFTDDTNFGHSDEKLPDIRNGSHDFPPELVNKALESVNGYVIIYSFQRVNGGALSDFTQLSAENHLITSGVYQNMSR